MRTTILFIGLLSITSCEIPNRMTSNFSFLEINELKLEGRNSGFSDVWYSQDGQIKGVYEIPRKIPVVSDGEISGVIQAGIRENGINSSPRVYPFVGHVEINANLGDGEVLQVNPDFSYLEQTKFRLDADFEIENSFGYDEDGVADIGLKMKGGLGELFLQAGETIEEATILVYNEIPKNGSPVFLEIEYRGNLDLDVGLIGVTGSDVFKEYFVSLRSEDEWKKAYINFTDLVLASNLTGYQIILGADNSNGSDEAIVYVDNIKLLHF